LLDKNGKPVINNANEQLKQQISNNKIQFEKIFPVFYTYFQNEIANNSKNPLDYYKLSYLDFYFFNEEKALMNLLRYINAKVNNPFLNLLAGKIYINKYYNTKNNIFLEKANTYFNSIIDAFPNFLKVKEYLCQYTIEKQDIKNSYNNLDKYFGNDFKSGANLWAEYFDLIHWETMKYQLYADNLNDSSRNAIYRLELADHLKNIQPEVSISYLTNIKNHNFPILNKNELLDLYLKKSDATNYFKLLTDINQFNKYDKTYYNYLSLYQINNNNFDSALNSLNQLLKIKYSSGTLIALADLYQKNNDLKSALKYYKLAYEANPINLNLYKKISYLEKNKIFYSTISI